MIEGAYEFFCPYCHLWIDDTVHRQHFHNDLDDPDDRRDWRVRVDGIVYDEEEDYLDALVARTKGIPAPAP